MEIHLGWKDLLELVYVRRVKIGGTVLTVDGPATNVYLVPGKEHEGPQPGEPRSSKELLRQVAVHGRKAATAEGGMTPREFERLRDFAVELNALLDGSA